MVFYVRRGEVPESRHTFDDREKLLREELFGEDSFEGVYSLIYHINEPTRVRNCSVEIKEKLVITDEPYLHRHLRTQNLETYGDILDGRKTILANSRVQVQIFKPEKTRPDFYRNALYEMLFFVHKGEGKIISPMGSISFVQGDYLYIPKGLMFRMEYSSGSYFLILNSMDDLKIPERYLNRYGQLKEGTPYYTRDIRPPEFNPPRRESGSYHLYVEYDDRYVVEEFDFNPLDVVGWDGYLFPFAINVKSMAPIVGKLHQPPPVHETMSSRSMMVATFLPRPFDFHDRSIPISYYHNNIDVDEFLFYSSGNFMSRKGIEPGSVTLHVRGLMHGPQPGAVENSIGRPGTDEVAVMIETYDPLLLTDIGKLIDDKEYMKSWYS
ncbi:MAG: homogentisate 1,2-dioxygenase [Candidatus Thermoplasmatota archaeon]|jgi:homogentisate 1,2-dioxygenase|nr:homogentisate 1,2-dioxygenase [Candidatus Thermoplasmatota archaeon]MCL5790736.1 homogentisate 1,2-dioxygenase [Candidatus Thermoplasmatota archaeon]